MTVADALAKYLTRYRLTGRRGYPVVEMRIRKHIGPFFGERPTPLTEDDLVAYWEWRAGRGAKNATVRAELAALRRALKLARMPAPGMPEDLTADPPRVGFLELKDFERVENQLPDHLKDPFRFSYITGWRMRSEVLTLLKTDVDFTGGWIQLRDSKNRTPRRFPLDCLGLRDLCGRQMERAPVSAPWLFHRFGGKQIKNVYCWWRRACKVVTIQAIPHDFRRSAVRNLVNAGIDQATAMLLTGHKTADVFRRYRIVNEADLKKAGDLLTGLLS